MQLIVMKKCSKCGLEKSIDEFWKSKRYKDKHYPSCKDCQRKNNIHWLDKNKDYYRGYALLREKSPQRIFQRIKDRAKKVGIPLSFSQTQFVEWYANQDKQCTYCGIRLEDLGKTVNDTQLKRFNRTLSVDRKNPTLGYDLDNITLACTRCNLTKNDFFSFNEMKEIGNKYIKSKHKVL